LGTSRTAIIARAVNVFLGGVGGSFDTFYHANAGHEPTREYL
jgi:hypothetical protein